MHRGGWVGSWRIIVRAITRCRAVGGWKRSYRAIALAEGGAENPVGFRRGRGSEECRSERARARSEASPATADASNSACLSKGAIVSPNNFHTCHDFLRVMRVSVSSMLAQQTLSILLQREEDTRSRICTGKTRVVMFALPVSDCRKIPATIVASLRLSDWIRIPASL